MAEQKRIGHRRMDDSGNVTFKKIQTTQIMGSIQLGITTAIGSLASKPERDLLMKDFMEVETVPFTKAGSQQTPAHHYNDFKFKTYAPIAFRHFRALFCIKTDDFLISVCNAPLRELTNPGASGSVFYLTHDDDFIIKTVQHKEAEFLLKLLPGYYMNLRQNPRTLLPKFFGQYCYICGGKNVRLIIMNNLLPSTIKMHQKYDLKGSTYKRKASSYERSKPSPTFKDLDFMEHHSEGLILEPDTYNALMKTIQTDLRVLESFKIMDFSLLVGVHNLDLAKREDDDYIDQVETSDANDEQRSIRDKIMDANNAGEGTSVGGVSTNKPQTNRPGLSALHSSVGMESMNQSDVLSAIPARNSKGENLLLFMGIIDILQSYRFKKKLEHTFKSMIHDGDSISVHKPSYYSQRFHEFMATKVFKSSSNSPTKRRRTVQTDL